MKVITFHMNQLGDFLFSLNCIYELNKFFNVCCLIRKNLAGIAKATNLFANILTREDGVLKKYELLKKIKEEKFDLAIHFSQSTELTLISTIAGIPERIGFSPAPLSFLYTKRVPFTPPPSIENNNKLLETIGIKVEKKDYRGLINVEEKTLMEVRKKIDGDNFVIISPGSSKRRKYKRWNPKKFAKLIDYLHLLNLECMLTGTKDEKDYINLIYHLASYKPLNMVGETSLEELAALMSVSRLFIGVDSGAMHLAAALGLPIVALFGRTSPEVVGPRSTRKKIIKKDKINNISPEEVLEKVKELLTEI